MDGWPAIACSLSAKGMPTLPPCLRKRSGDQRYILDYLTEVVLHQQPPEVQRFLLFTTGPSNGLERIPL